MPTKRLRRGVFNICGITDVTYKRFFAVPFVTNEKRKKYLEDVKKLQLTYENIKITSYKIFKKT